ncbi:hypothetical protein C8F01DRAFT_1286424 [Mycena amicta]|nr:hypothetical protein C8F01DRAFT_1286424 [Mycena amicta]
MAQTKDARFRKSKQTIILPPTPSSSPTSTSFKLSPPLEPTEAECANPTRAKRAITDVLEHFSPTKKRRRSPSIGSAKRDDPHHFPFNSPARASTPLPIHTRNTPNTPRSPLRHFVETILQFISPSKGHSPQRGSSLTAVKTPTRQRHRASLPTPHLSDRDDLSFNGNRDRELSDRGSNHDSFGEGATPSIPSDDDEPDRRPIEDIDDPPESDNEQDVFGSRLRYQPRGNFVPPPTLVEAEAACTGIDMLLRPRRGKKAYKENKFKTLTKERLEAMRRCLRLYIRRCKDAKEVKPGLWTNASQDAAVSANHSKWLDNYGKNGLRASLDDEDISLALTLHLQSLGKYISAKTIIEFCGTPEMLERMGRTKPVSVFTARRWLKKMGYRWKKRPRGLYVDGHERDDVVKYRQNVFVPTMEEIEKRMRCCLPDGSWGVQPGVERANVLWHQDESTFYQNDQRMVYWIPPNDPCVPLPKGEGYSIMANGIVSADYGWLESPDRSESILILFRAGKKREGYYTSEHVLEHLKKAVTLAQKLYPNNEHIFMYDNTSTHLARPETARSTLKMTLGPSAAFCIKKTDVGENGKETVRKLRMDDGWYYAEDMVTQIPQSFYFPTGHPLACQFKGIKHILTERGHNVAGKKLQCNSKRWTACEDHTSRSCCQRRMLYNEPDFVHIPSRLEKLAEELGTRVIFSPRFHPEVNFIEQCWGNGKHFYRELEPCETEDEIEVNIMQSLRQIPLETMRKYSVRSLRWVDAYRGGLTGKDTSFAMKKYHGHRHIPADQRQD